MDFAADYIPALEIEGHGDITHLKPHISIKHIMSRLKQNEKYHTLAKSQKF